MSGLAIRGRATASRRRPGLALVRALELAGLALAGAALLVTAAGPAAALLLGLGFLVDGLVRGRPGGGDISDLLVIAAGLAGTRLVLPGALLAARRLAALTRRLAGQWAGGPVPGSSAPRPARPPGTAPQPGRQRVTGLLADAATWRDLAWLAVSATVGLVLLLVPLTLTGTGLVAFIVPGLGGLGELRGLPHPVPPPAFPGNTSVVLLGIGAALTAVGAGLAPAALRGHAGLARLILAPPGRGALEQRVAHLSRTRTETLDTGAAELRRIERDLHDGAQARLLALGLALDAAQRLLDTDPAAARVLLGEARDASARALTELRDLVRGIHPPVLADRGLADAVRALALDGPLRVTVAGTLPGRLPAPVESAAYFAVSELLVNVARHAGVGSAEIGLRHEGGALRVSVRDEGTGGADPARGTGLRGIERRLAAFDGALAVSSPPGGPTVITLDVPCASS